MSETMKMEDLQAVIANEMRGAMQELAKQSLANAEEAAAKRAEKGGSPLDALAQVRAQVARETNPVVLPYGLRNDPLKGAGLGFVRMLKAEYEAQASKRTTEKVAEAWANLGHRQYATLPEEMKVAREFADKRRGMTEGSFAAGGSLLYPEQGEFIELLYARTLAYFLGAISLEFAKAMDLGKLNSGVTAAYTGEAQNIVPSTPGTGVAKLTSRVVSALVGISNALLRNPSISADIMVRDELLMRIGLKRDLSFFRGTGGEFQPKGILNWIRSSNKVSQTVTTLAGKVTDLVGLISLVDSSDVDTSGAAFAMNPRAKWGLASTLDGQGKFVFAEMLARNELLGFKVGTTTQIPTNLGGGTNETEIYFGAFNDAILGLDSTTPLTVEAFPNGAFHDGTSVVSGISTDQSPIRAMEGHDVLLRHDNAIGVLQAVTWWI